MGQKYAVYNIDTLKVRGFLDSDVHSDIPDNAVEITQAKWEELKQENNSENYWTYDKEIDDFHLQTPAPPTLKEIKNDELRRIRNKAGELIDYRFKPFDRENLFILENKTDIQDYYLDARATKQEVSDAINAMRDACNSLETDISNATDKDAVNDVDISKDNLISIAEW